MNLFYTLSPITVFIFLVCTCSNGSVKKRGSAVQSGQGNIEGVDQTSAEVLTEIKDKIAPTIPEEYNSEADGKQFKPHFQYIPTCI